MARVPNVQEYERYLELCREIWHHNRAYFLLDSPEITDEAYDLLFEKLKQDEMKNPDWVHAGSPTKHVGEKGSGRFQTQTHLWPMLSYDKVFDFEGLLHFDERCRKTLGRSPSYHAEVKIDGCAASLWYHNGKLDRGVTRGDGFAGDLITENLMEVTGIPHTLPNQKGSCEIRGEVYMTFSALDSVNTIRAQSGLEKFSNTRNCASGTLKALDPHQVRERKLSFFGYFLSCPEIESIHEMMSQLKGWNVPIPSPSLSNVSMEEIFSFIREVEKKREHLLFQIDGIVVKVNCRQDQILLGSTGQCYRWGIAFKYQACRIKTRIRSISLQMGRSGCITPVALLEPIHLDGSCVSKATLHNFSRVLKNDIREGDWVWICKGGDVIPKILEVDLASRPEGTEPLAVPTHCPFCQTSLELEHIALLCPNPCCEEKCIQSLIHFAEELSIDGMGKRTLEELVKRKHVKDWADLYTLEMKELEELPQGGPVFAQKLLQAIEASKKVPFSVFLSALGIRYIGKRNARVLAKKCDSWADLRALSVDELQFIPGFGEKVAQSTQKVLDNLEARVQALFSLGVLPFSEKQSTSIPAIFNGVSFVITGKFTRGSRREIENLVRDQGGCVLSSLSYKTDYLLVGEDPGNKLKKAQSLKINIVNETWLFSNLEKVYQNASQTTRCPIWSVGDPESGPFTTE